jgi:hypothetical protein
MVADDEKENKHKLTKISHSMVGKVLDDRTVRDEIKKIFSITLRIDMRYELIAYAVAYLVLNAEVEGRIEEGVTLREIRDAALSWWDRGFAEKARPSLFEDLLDEMEGLGILRRIDNERWSLRSTAVLRLLGNRDEIERVLEQYIGKEAPRGFDPKSHRRSLEFEKITSPLTFSQERELLTGGVPVHVIVGNELADIDAVAPALRSAPNSFSDSGKFEIVAKRFESREELIQTLRKANSASGKSVIIVVHSGSKWTPDWIAETLKARPGGEKQTKVVFVGGPQHAEQLLTDKRFQKLPPNIAVTSLEPWSEAFLEQFLKKYNFPWDSVREHVYESVGGWNSPMNKIRERIEAQKGVDESKFRRAINDAIPREFAGPMGIQGVYGDLLERMAGEYRGEPFSAEDIDVWIKLDDRFDGITATGETTISFGMQMGLLTPFAGRSSTDGRKSKFAFTKFASKGLALRKEAAE